MEKDRMCDMIEPHGFNYYRCMINCLKIIKIINLPQNTPIELIQAFMVIYRCKADFDT